MDNKQMHRVAIQVLEEQIRVNNFSSVCKRDNNKIFLNSKTIKNK
jgi:hypothetical protein